MSDLRGALERVDQRTTWTLATSTPVEHRVGHPQGLVPWGGGWMVSTVHLDPVRGEVLVVDAAGACHATVDVTDGPRIHPGGLSVTDDGGVVVAVAEYRPDSSTLLRRVDSDLSVTDIARIDDHLGAVAPLADGSFFAVSWGSRRFYRLAADGAVVAVRDNESHFVDHQDVTVLDGAAVVATGVGHIAAPGGPVMLGGLAIVDVDELRTVRTTPIHAWMPSGRVVTYNGAHVGGGDPVELTCIVDDEDAHIATWRMDID